MFKFISILLIFLVISLTGCGETNTQDNLDTLMITDTLNKNKVEDGTKFVVGEDSKVLLNNNDNSIIAITFDEETVSVWCQEDSCNKPEIIDEVEHPPLCVISPDVKQVLKEEYCDENLSEVACDILLCSLVES